MLLRFVVFVLAVGTGDAGAEDPVTQPVRDAGGTMPAGAVLRFGGSGLRHGDAVQCLAFSPDGKTLASGSAYRDSTIRLWDVATGRERIRIPSLLGTVWSLAFSPDGGVLYSGGGRRFPLRVWDVATGKMIRQMSLDPQWAKVYCVALSPDGKNLITGNTNATISLWNSATGVEISRFGDRSDAGTGLSFSPDGMLVVSWGTHSRKMRLWDVAKGQQIHEFDATDLSTHAVFSPDGKTVAAGALDGRVRTWSVPEGGAVAQYTGHKGEVTSVVFSPDGKKLVSSGKDKTIRIWETSSGAERSRIEGLGATPHIVLSPDGRTLAARFALSSVIRMWDIESGEALRGSGEAEAPWFAVAYTDNGKTLATAELSRVRLWEAESGNTIRELAVGTDVSGIAVSSDVGTLYTRSRRALSGREFEQTVRAWNSTTGENRLVYRGMESGGRLSPDGRTIALWDHMKPVRLRNLESGVERRVVEQAVSRNLVTAFSPRGDRFALATPQGEVVVWEVSSGNGVARFESGMKHVRRLEFSADGSLLACAAAWKNDVGERAISLFELESGQRLRALDGHTGEVSRIAFSQDGKLLASASVDKTILVWSLATGDEIGRFHEVGSTPTCITFSPDGKRLISGMSGGGGLAWRLRD